MLINRPLIIEILQYLSDIYCTSGISMINYSKRKKGDIQNKGNNSSTVERPWSKQKECCQKIQVRLRKSFINP